MMACIKRMLRKIHEEAGFTLIELMVVMVILGTLAAVAVPQFRGQTDTAKISAAKTDLSSIQSAMDLYYLDYSSYPTPVTDASGLRTALITASGTGKGPYLQQMNASDPWGNSYGVAQMGASSYFVYTLGPAGTGNLYYLSIPGGLYVR